LQFLITFIQVIVNLRDINDNEPKFPRTTVSVPITENSAREIVDITPAMDNDVGENTIQVRIQVISFYSKLEAAG
jgi:hypothetical protein